MDLGSTHSLIYLVNKYLSPSCVRHCASGKNVSPKLFYLHGSYHLIGEISRCTYGQVNKQIYKYKQQWAPPRQIA